MSFGITEDAKRLVDAITAGVSALGLIAGGLWTLKKYFDDRDSERVLAREKAKSAEVEARKPFSSKQLDLYFEAVEAASDLASKGAHPGPQWDHFWRLYFGPMALVEDQKVALAMVEFGKALSAQSSPEQLTTYALKLAHACRDSIAESWKVPAQEFDSSRFAAVAMPLFDNPKLGK